MWLEEVNELLNNGWSLIAVTMRSPAYDIPIIEAWYTLVKIKYLEIGSGREKET